jgi:putative ABC transport system substrate-binding protein
MKRRSFITLLFGAVAAWPLAARAQQDGRVRRIGVLIGAAADVPQWQSFQRVFREGLAKLGWIEGQNLHIDFRHGSADPIRIRAHASELVRLAPEVLVAGTGPAARAMREETHTMPIVAVGMGDPDATRMVENIACPESNVTGFVNLFNSLGGKWLELLKEAAPRLRRVAVIVDPDSTVIGLEPYLIEPAAQTLAVDVEEIAYQNVPDLVRATDAFAVQPNGGCLSCQVSATPIIAW